MTETTMTLINTLREHPEHREWLDQLERVEVGKIDLYVPADDQLRTVLAELGVPEADIAQIVASRPTPDRTPDAWWLLERCAALLVRDMGNPSPTYALPAPMEIAGLDPYFYIHVFVAMLPYVREYHRAHGIPEDVARRTLADLGRNVRVHHKRYGEGGMGVAFWISLHFRGMIYELGRLQFERSRMRDAIANALRDRGEDVSPDDLVLSVHIPDFLGPLTPEACDASIAEAKRFFARHFPDEHFDYAVCHSWLLDPQLADHLPESSNIVQFQRRFELAEGGREADSSILQFVFGPAPEDLDVLPQRSTLERAVVSHLKSGNHWYSRSGWLPLD